MSLDESQIRVELRIIWRDGNGFIDLFECIDKPIVCGKNICS